jgi:hypothetical protein
MLTEAERELVAAAVDGELTPDEQADFRKLIAESADAHALYLCLCRDRARLRKLPPQRAPEAVFAEVMARVREHARPAGPARPAVAPRHPVWLPLGLAASLFVCISGASYLYFQSLANANRITAQAHALPREPDAAKPTDDTTQAVVHVPGPVRRERTPQPRPVAEAVATAIPTPEVAPVPRSVAADSILTSSVGPDVPFTAVQVRLPVLVSFADLANDDARRRVAAELARESAFRIDLFAADQHKAAEALVASGRSVGLTVTIDAVANERLKKKLPFAWAVCVESLTPDEVADWLATAARPDAAGLPPVGTAHVLPAGKPDQKEWRELLGVEPAWAKRAEASAPAKPISAGTADQVASALEKTGAAKSERHAIVVTYLPRDGRIAAALSKEVKLFTERRGERKPAAVAVMIVVRPPNS